MTAGTAYVGDFKEAMTLFDRGNLAVYMTDSHASEFVDNVLRLLPALNISDADIAEALTRLDQTATRLEQAA